MFRDPSEGARAQIVVRALTRVLSRRIKALKIEGGKLTVTGVYAKRVIDVELFSEGSLVKVVSKITYARKLRGT